MDSGDNAITSVRVRTLSHRQSGRCGLGLLGRADWDLTMSAAARRVLCETASKVEQASSCLARNHRSTGGPGPAENRGPHEGLAGDRPVGSLE